MKRSLMILSSLTTLALASNCALSVVNTTINAKLNSNPTDPNKPTWLFNNSFGYLNQGNWITNQATTDNKYYSYDTTHAVGNLSDGTPTRNAFIVDNTGSLIIKPELKLSGADKSMLNNIKSEIISDKSDKKVTVAKDNTNLYSKSVYSDSYFSGDNSDWKYLQMGGVEKPIDISNQQSANKVANNTILNESVGLYYIAQAERKPGGIDSAVANNLGKYFISQGSLNNKFDDSLTNNIINLIVNNDNVYNLMSYEFKNYGPNNLSKNLSMNYIFDSNNNIIEVYCNQWNNESPITNLNYYFDQWEHQYESDHSNVYMLLNWKNYASSWEIFTTLYPKIMFTNSTLIIQNSISTQTLNNPIIDTADIKTDQGSGNTNTVFYLKQQNFKTSDLFNIISVDIWHDDNGSILIKWFCSMEEGAQIEVKLSSICFANVMI